VQESRCDSVAFLSLLSPQPQALHFGPATAEIDLAPIQGQEKWSEDDHSFYPVHLEDITYHVPGDETRRGLDRCKT
jgi:hypothetical protein